MVLRSPRHPGLARHAAGITNRFPAEPLAPGRPWPEALEEILAHDGWTEADLAPWADRWITALRAEFLGAVRVIRCPISTRTSPVMPSTPFRATYSSTATGLPSLTWNGSSMHLGFRAPARARARRYRPDHPHRRLARPESDPTYLTLLRAATACLGAPLSDAAIAERLDREARFQQIVSGRETNRNFAWLASTHPVPARSC